MLNDPEEEHDCFSDNTHNSHFHDALGVMNVYTGRYVRTDGTVLSGPSLADLVAAKDAMLDTELRMKLNTTMAEMAWIVAQAEGGLAYDQMLAPGNAEGETAITRAIDALIAQTASIERAVTALGLSQIIIEGSDSLDDPNAVFQ
jgi:putative iron-regulated protein